MDDLNLFVPYVFLIEDYFTFDTADVKTCQHGYVFLDACSECNE